MENNTEIITVNQKDILPANAGQRMVPARTSWRQEQNQADAAKVAVDLVKEGLATVKDNRILRKKMVEADIEAAKVDMSIQQTEYNRVKTKLETGKLTAEERAHCEARIETLADRIHESSQTHQKNMNENMPKTTSGLSNLVWLGFSLLIGSLAFAGGYQYCAQRQG